MRGVFVLTFLLACRDKAPPAKVRVEQHWPPCAESQLHADTETRHRCVTYLRMKCGDGGGIAGPMNICGGSMQSDWACGSACPCGLVDFGHDNQRWRICGRIDENEPRFADPR